MTTTKEKILTTKEVSRYCDVTVHAVNKWVNTGKLKAYRTPGNRMKILENDFSFFLEKYNMLVPQDFKNRLKKRKKILIVDDDNTSVRLIKGLLEKQGDYEIETAQDGFEAGLKYSAFKPDLITLDLKMPGLNGFEVCTYIRVQAKDEDIKILVISAYLDSKNLKKVKLLGADDFLGKPFKGVIFHKKIVALFERQEQC